MAKKQINYSDLSTQELDLLKEKYIDLKVKSMNNNDLRVFAFENISLQIKNTIGNEEELEAWCEMEDFFKDEFDTAIRDIQLQMKSKNDHNYNKSNEVIKSESEGKEENKKIDMWED
tara:strand:+ start:173 stop:523 length:351 start_codon:yes stop_codon:yes gene_type:complete